MCFKLIFGVTVLCAVLLQTHQANTSYRIVGGVAVTEKKYRYFVRLDYGGALSCGGSLVRNDAVVTAAHCVKGRSAAMMEIHADSINLSNNGVTRGVKKVIISTGYNDRTMNSDVAVLILDSAIPSDKFKAIPLNRVPVAAGTKCLIIGHGKTKEDGSIARQLQEASVSIISQSSCRRSYRRSSTITDNMMCAEPGKRDSCSGDSGGPLVCNGNLAGIVSWGIGCARARYPGVYTDISKVYDFIMRSLERYP